MFDIGWTELIIVGVVALIVIGPKELPGVLRMLGQWIAKVRRMAADFQGQFQEAMREAEMADLKKEVDDLADSTRDLASGFNPIESIEDAIGDPRDDEPNGVVADKTKGDDRAAVAEARAISAEDPTEPAAQPHADPPPVPEPEPVPALAGEAAPPDDTRADAEDAAPPPQKAAAGGHSA